MDQLTGVCFVEHKQAIVFFYAYRVILFHAGMWQLIFTPTVYNSVLVRYRADRHLSILGLHFGQMFGFLPEQFPRRFPCALMGSPVAFLIQPLQCRAVQGIYTGIQPALQKDFFYIADEALNLAFRLRVALVAEYNAETRLAHKVFKLRHQYDIAVLFADNKQPILVIQDCLRPAAEIT